MVTNTETTKRLHTLHEHILHSYNLGYEIFVVIQKSMRFTKISPSKFYAIYGSRIFRTNNTLHYVVKYKHFNQLIPSLCLVLSVLYSSCFTAGVVQCGINSLMFHTVIEWIYQCIRLDACCLNVLLD